MAVTPDRPSPFYYELQLCLTEDRVWVELSARHPIYGRAIWDSWGMLKPHGACTDDYVHMLMWSALLEAGERSSNRS